MSTDREAAALAIDAFLRAIGRDSALEGELVGTGHRVAAAFMELTSGYAVDTRALLAESALATSSSSLVVLRDAPVVTTCPHHLLPAVGMATIAIQSRERVVGLGTLAALVDAHARRLALQETIGEHVVADLERALEPRWVACRLVMTHACVVVRGERAVGSRVETVAVRGASRTDELAVIHRALGVGA